MDLRRLGSLIRTVDAGEVLDLAGPRPLVEPLGIAGFGDGERRIDKDLDEFAGLEDLPRQLPLGPEGRDEGREHDQAGIDEQFGDFRHAPDVFDAIGCREAEIPVDAMPQIVAVEQVGVTAEREQSLFDHVSDRRLARTERPVNQRTAGR